MNLSPEKKIAGVLVPLFALRGEKDLGIGDLGALREFIDWIAEIGFTLVQLLPINETGADNSPYNAISSMAIEPTTLHLAPGSPEDLTRNDFEQSFSEIDLADLRRGRVKYRQVKELKQRILEKAFANFSARADEKRQFEFKRFCEEEASWLHDYALFRVLIEENNGSPTWDRWPSPHQSTDSARNWIRELPDDKAGNPHTTRRFLLLRAMDRSSAMAGHQSACRTKRCGADGRHSFWHQLLQRRRLLAPE